MVRNYLVDQEEKRANLQDNSVDLVFIEFTLNELNTDWIIMETSRILKEKGRLLLIEAAAFDHILVETFVKFVINAKILELNKRSWKLNY